MDPQGAQFRAPPREVGRHAAAELEREVLYPFLRWREKLPPVGVVPAPTVPLRPIIDVDEVHRKRQEEDRRVARELRERERHSLMRIEGATEIAVMSLLTHERRLQLLARLHHDTGSLFSRVPQELLCELEEYLDHYRDRVVYEGCVPVLIHEGHPVPDRRGDMIAAQYAQCDTGSNMWGPGIWRAIHERQCRPATTLHVPEVEPYVTEFWQHIPRSEYRPKSPPRPKPRPRRERRPKTVQRGRRSRR